MYQNHDKKEVWKIRALMAVWTVIVFFGISVLFGYTDFDDPTPVGDETTEAETAGTETTEGTEAETVSLQPELPVSEEEEELLSSLYAAMEVGDFAQTAQLLNTEEEALKTLTAETLNGAVWLYYEQEENGTSLHYMEQLGEGAAGEGLALSRYNTAFFGSFQNGRPEGSCLAVQAVVTDAPRYTYASGTWSNGKMNGEGETGYRYYETIPEGSYAGIRKSGTYSENLLDGAFVYEVEGADGEVFSWDMEAAAGVTVLNDSWVYSEASGTYALGARDHEDRTYVLEGAQAQSVLWNNLIIWGE